MRSLDMVLCALTFVTFAFNLFVNYYIGKGGERFGLNFSSIGDVSRIYNTDITPAGWAFSIWGLIYLWQILLQVYLALTIFCRETASQVLRNLFDVGFSNLAAFYVLYIVNQLCTMGWVVTWCLGYVIYASPFITLTPVCLWWAVRIAVKGSSEQNADQKGRQQPPTATAKALMVLFVHNGLGLYATWSAIASLINMTIVLNYYKGLTRTASCTIALMVLAALILTWFVLDLTRRRATRYLLTPYCVVVFALAASLVRNWNNGSQTGIFLAVLLAVASVLFIVKLVLVAVARCNRWDQPTKVAYRKFGKEQLVGSKDQFA